MHIDLAVGVFRPFSSPLPILLDCQGHMKEAYWKDFVAFSTWWPNWCSKMNIHSHMPEFDSNGFFASRETLIGATGPGNKHA